MYELRRTLNGRICFGKVSRLDSNGGKYTLIDSRKNLNPEKCHFTLVVSLIVDIEIEAC